MFRAKADLNPNLVEDDLSSDAQKKPTFLQFFLNMGLKSFASMEP